MEEQLLPFKTRSINQMKKNPNILESLFNLTHCLNSSGMCSSPNLSKYVALLDATTLSPFTYKAIQLVPIDLYPYRFITNSPSFILGKLFLEETPLNLGLLC